MYKLKNNVASRSMKRENISGLGVKSATMHIHEGGLSVFLNVNHRILDIWFLVHSAIVL